MSLIESMPVTDAVNDLLFEIAQVPHRDPIYQGEDAVSRNIPRLTEEGDDIVIIPPIRLSGNREASDMLPFEARITQSGIGAVAISTEGVIHPPASVNPDMVVRYKVEVGEMNSYQVTRRSSNGTEYIFSTNNPETVQKAMVLCLGKITDKAKGWNGRRFIAD
ncbi:hypothetical protein KDA00_02325 [Candidatus Saccharibacteria bacterium]|nr:hypothetical protein [Candidatus Saccharibacteria bacterium]